MAEVKAGVAGPAPVYSVDNTNNLIRGGSTSGTRPARVLRKSFSGDQNDSDPSQVIKGMPPNFGESLLPHVISFQGIVSSVARVYRPSDEALKDSRDNARFMRNDPAIMECIECRQRATALLDWHLEPDDEDDPTQEFLCKEISKIIKRIPRFMQYRENLLHALWYGRYGVQHRWVWKQVGRHRRLVVDRWLPVNGDKLVFRYDDGTGQFNPNQVGIRVGAGFTTGDSVAKRWHVERINKVEPTDYGLAYFLEEWERELLAIHKHQVEDGEYEEPQNAGRIHGVGIRSRIYWTWFQKQESLAWLMEFLERSAFGIEIWYYPWGNEQAREKTRKAAEERIGQGRNIVLVPRPIGEESMSYGVERIEPGMQGADILKDILTEYFGHQIKRYVLGQVLTTEAQATGLGSELANVHLDTFLQIVKYDATNLEETLTTDLVDCIKKFNWPQYADVPIRFKIETEAPDVAAKLEAWQRAYEMGCKLKATDVMDLIGAGMPEEDDDVLHSPEHEQAAQQMQQAEQQQAMDEQRLAMEGQGQEFSQAQEAERLEMEKQRDQQQLAQSMGVDSQLPAEVQEPLEPEDYDADGTPRSQNSERVPVDQYKKTAAFQRTLEEALDQIEDPSEEQKEAGNYRKGHLRLHGLDVTIETAKGATRSGTDPQGKSWSVVMPYNYGYIRRTTGKDGDHVDVFLGPEPESELVFIVDQMDPKGKRFDEHKVMIGWDTAESAKKAYLAAYEGDWQGCGKITSLGIEQFKAWLTKGDTTIPAAKQISRYARKPSKGQASFAWQESKHPRGQPENAGQFGPGGAGGGFTSGDEVSHAKGVRATKDLGGQVPQRDVNAADKVLQKAGLAPSHRKIPKKKSLSDMDYIEKIYTKNKPVLGDTFSVGNAHVEVIRISPAGGEGVTAIDLNIIGPKSGRVRTVYPEKDWLTQKTGAPKAESGKPKAGAPPVTDPKIGETASDYMDRMLGPIGSTQRKIGDPAAAQYYLQIWDAWQKQHGQPAEGGSQLPARRSNEIVPAPADPKSPRATGEKSSADSFKAWFGDSKVVDDKGQPLVVYHGTDANFEEFQDTGGPIFFGTEQKSRDFAGEEGRVIEAHLSIQNPVELPWVGTLGLYSNDIREYKKQGYDGARMRDGVWVVFKPTQIKSATENQGTFDPENPDIRYAAGCNEPKQKQEQAIRYARSFEPDRVNEQLLRAYYGGDDPENFDGWMASGRDGTRVLVQDGQPMRYERHRGNVSVERLSERLPAEHYARKPGRGQGSFSWNEEDHPRADDGKFSEHDGGAEPSDKKKRGLAKQAEKIEGQVSRRSGEKAESGEPKAKSPEADIAEIAQIEESVDDDLARAAKEDHDDDQVEAVLVSGKTYKERSRIKALGGKWNQDEGGWLVPAEKRKDAEALAEEHGWEIDDVQTDAENLTTPTGERLRTIRGEKNKRKAQRLRDQASRLQATASGIDKRLAPYDDLQFWTEPVKIGHHSESRHRNLRTRLSNLMDKKHEAQAKAAELIARAKRLELSPTIAGDAEKRREVQRHRVDRMDLSPGDVIDATWPTADGKLTVLKIHAKSLTVKVERANGVTFESKLPKDAVRGLIEKGPADFKAKRKRNVKQVTAEEVFKSLETRDKPMLGGIQAVMALAEDLEVSHTTAEKLYHRDWDAYHAKATAKTPNP